MLYFAACASLITAILSSHWWLPILICQALLGLVYAHGLELAHECLHENMYRAPRVNRLFGFVAGLPMLVSYTHYKYQHLHHHRYVGTSEDKELFDYREECLHNPVTFLARALNVNRIPSFFLTLFQMCRGIYPEVCVSPRQRRQVLSEYLALAAIFAVATVLTVSGSTDVFLLVWFIPWLVFGEVFHFFIELPEHLGRDKMEKNIYINTRSYSCSTLFCYIINGNNYHVEHHLYPRVAMHNLNRLNKQLDSQAEHTVPSYRSALNQVFARRPELNRAAQVTTT